jgi:hypothetical protein
MSEGIILQGTWNEVETYGVHYYKIHHDSFGEILVVNRW